MTHPTDEDRAAAEEAIERITAILPQLRKMEAQAAFGGATTSVRVRDPEHLIETLEMALAGLKSRIAAERRALERAAQACEGERLSNPQDDADVAYDCAIDDCINAIRNLKGT